MLHIFFYTFIDKKFIICILQFFQYERVKFTNLLSRFVPPHRYKSFKKKYFQKYMQELRKKTANNKIYLPNTKPTQNTTKTTNINTAQYSQFFASPVPKSFRGLKLSRTLSRDYTSARNGKPRSACLPVKIDARDAFNCAADRVTLFLYWTLWRRGAFTIVSRRTCGVKMIWNFFSYTLRS